MSLILMKAKLLKFCEFNVSAAAVWNTATAVNHIITNSVINAEFKTGISDHFPIFFIFKCLVDSTQAREEFI